MCSLVSPPPPVPSPRPRASSPLDIPEMRQQRERPTALQLQACASIAAITFAFLLMVACSKVSETLPGRLRAASAFLLSDGRQLSRALARRRHGVGVRAGGEQRLDHACTTTGCVQRVTFCGEWARRPRAQLAAA